LLRRGIVGGAVMLVPASGFAGRAEAAGIPDLDLAYLRVLVGVELLKVDFQVRASMSNRLAATPARLVRRMLLDDKAHYVGLAALMNGAGQTPATGGDIDFSYPRGSFSSQAAIVKLAWRLATLALGAYLGAVENVDMPELRLPLGQIAANEAQQVGALAQLLGRPVIGGAFAPSLQIDAVSAALDEFES